MAGLLVGGVALREFEENISKAISARFTQQLAVLVWQPWWSSLLPQVRRNFLTTLNRVSCVARFHFYVPFNNPPPLSFTSESLRAYLQVSRTEWMDVYEVRAYCIQKHSGRTLHFSIVASGNAMHSLQQLCSMPL